MYGFIELRTDDERFVLSTLLRLDEGIIDRNWVSLIIQEDVSTSFEPLKMNEIACWDNREYLVKTLIPALKKCYEDKITLTKFCNLLDKVPDKQKAKDIFKKLEDVHNLHELFEKAKKFKMI